VSLGRAVLGKPAANAVNSREMIMAVIATEQEIIVASTKTAAASAGVGIA